MLKKLFSGNLASSCRVTQTVHMWELYIWVYMAYMLKTGLKMQLKEILLDSSILLPFSPCFIHPSAHLFTTDRAVVNKLQPCLL